MTLICSPTPSCSIHCQANHDEIIASNAACVRDGVMRSKNPTVDSFHHCDLHLYKYLTISSSWMSTYGYKCLLSAKNCEERSAVCMLQMFMSTI